jgi:hypothetical protein
MKVEKCLSNCFHAALPNMSEKQRVLFSHDICSNPEVLRLIAKVSFYQGVNSDRAVNANLRQQPLS